MAFWLEQCEILRLVGLVRKLQGRACVDMGLWDSRSCRDRNLYMSDRDKATGQGTLVKSFVLDLISNIGKRTLY